MSDTREPAPPTADGTPRHLRADCQHCCGLCCVAPAFSASADFAIDKAAGRPCPNLRADFRCGIHDDLVESGFRGCAAYDCFGAGQKVTQITFGGQDWRRDPSTAQQMFDVYGVVRQLHELLWFVTEALRLGAARPLHSELAAVLDETEAFTLRPPDALLEVDVAAHRKRVGALLTAASDFVRGPLQRPRRDLTGADLVGADLRGADLQGANLMGAGLIAADLRDADLTTADLRGADLRDADVRGTDLSHCIFVTQSQVASARGDRHTKLPVSLTRPAHWAAPATCSTPPPPPSGGPPR